MKKLNKKGFTLVELLAIIVILAIILVVTVPAVFSAIDNSRKMSLENSAKGLAKWINDTIVSEQIQLQNLTALQATLPTTIGKWTCINQDRIIAEISADDYNLGGAAPTGTLTGPIVAASSCSAIAKVSDGVYAVLLVAKQTGKLYTASGAPSSNVMWATNTNLRSWTS